ncbi:MAG: hypothetical protein ACR2NU_12435 [Aeoliella sp.]
MPSHTQHAAHFPTWFRGIVIALATIVLSACQSTAPIAKHPATGANALGTTAGQASSGIPRPYPVQQAQFASQAWVDQAPTLPYSGDVPPCGCESCGGCPTSCSIVGPSDEYLCDGGDFGTPAGVRRDWEIEGLEQEDTISHYDTVDGRVVVKPSNRVCIYAPRFGAVRRVENLVVNHHRVGPGGIIDEMALASTAKALNPATSLQRHAPIASLGDQPASLFRTRLQAGGVETRLAAMDLETFLAPQLDLQIVKLGIIDNAEKPRLAKSIVSAYSWASDISAQVVIDAKQAHQQIGRTQPGEIYGLDEPNSPRIRLIKLASTGTAQLGEEVEFVLRFDNVGDQPIGNVTIIDNLATRLEYVTESAQATVDAEFFLDPNAGGSLILRWEIDEPLQPGEGGVLRFQAKVR